MIIFFQRNNTNIYMRLIIMTIFYDNKFNLYCKLTEWSMDKVGKSLMSITTTQERLNAQMIGNYLATTIPFVCIDLLAIF